MIVRVVKMTFEQEHAKDFFVFVGTLKETILGFDGCRKLTVYRDIHDPNVYFSYSIWDSEIKLNEYRRSDFFRETWTKTKGWFAEKAEAWSLEDI